MRVTHHDIVEEIQDVNQALERGRGRPQKMGVIVNGNRQDTNSPGPDKGSVPNRKVGCCLGPERNGVNPGKGSEGGPGPPDRERDKQSTTTKEGGSSNMEQEEEGKKSQT